MHHRISRRLALIGATIALALGIPLGAVVANHTFSDVPASHLFHGDITHLANSGVTTGCGGGRFCPDEFVTRGQMAAFMNRLGALAPGQPPVANAKTAQTAANADQLDGLDSSAFARPMFATVNASGTLARGAGVVSSSSLVGFDGSYQVIFNRNVTQCTYTATLGNPGSGNPPRGFIVTAARAGNANGVFVETRNTADVLANRSFHLQVSCVAPSGAITQGQVEASDDSEDGAN